MTLDCAQVPDYAATRSLSGQVFIVLGAGQGIGRQTAHALAQHGATVVCVGRGEEATKAVAEQVGGAAFLADAQNRGDMERLFAFVGETYGRLDGLVDIIAFGIHGGLFETTDESYQEQHDVVLRHAYLALQLGAPLMRDTGGGSFVLVSSIAGQRVWRNALFAYSIFKAGIDHMTRLAAVELGPWNIRVNAVSPGMIVTPRFAGFDEQWYAEAAGSFPLRRLGEPSDIANAILFLSCPMARNITGQVLVSDGGLTLQSPSPVPLREGT